MVKNQKIQYINPVNLSLLSYDGNHFEHLKNREKIYTTSRVLYENVTLYSFKIPSIQANDDLSSLVEIKMYEEAGLDVNKIYKITYLVKELDFDDMSLVEAFAIDSSLMEEIYEEPIKVVKYIDFLALPFFAFSTFYTNKILTPKNDIFVYIGEQEAFLSFYKDGLYISTKSMVNLSEIVEKLNLQNVDLDLKKLGDILSAKGLKQEMYEKIEAELYLALESIFSDMLTKINNIAMHNRSIFGFDKIDRIFFSTEYGRVKGLKEFIVEFGLVDVELLDFNLFKEKQESGFLDKIVCSYGFDKYVENSNEQNITLFDRPPPFLSTEFGKLSSGVAFILLVLGVVYGYFYIDIENKNMEQNTLESRYQNIETRANRYKRDIRKIVQEIKELKKDIKKQDIVYENIKQSIDRLEKMRGEDDRYISFLANINHLLAKYELRTTALEQIGRKKMVIDVVSKYSQRDKIAKFLSSLIGEGFVNVKTKEIRLDKDRYTSRIEIEHE